MAAGIFKLGTSVTLEKNHVQRLQELLPTCNYNYVVTSFKHGDAEDHMSLTLRLQISTKEELMEWKEKFQEKSFATYRVATTFPGIKGLRVSFKENYYCQHGSRGKGLRSKKTACKSTLGLILNIVHEKSRSKDQYLKTHPSIVSLNWCHDHPTNAASVLKHRDVAPSTREKFLLMFSNGHNPKSALEEYTAALQLELDDELEFVRILADRRIVPDVKYLYRLYDEMFRSKYGPSSGPPAVDNSPSPSTSAGPSCDISPPTSLEPSDHIPPSASSEPPGDTSAESYHDISASTEMDARVSPSSASSSASLHRIFQDLQQKLLDDPKTFKPSVDAFIKNYDNIGTDSGLISAFFAFGKYSRLSHKGKKVGGNRIRIQPTAIKKEKEGFW